VALITEKKVTLLVGGVGGAKLALGLQAIVPPENLTIIVNTGDDFWHYGLRICPDIDTVLYTLSGRVDQDNGWGVAGDSIVALDALNSLGEDTWFRLGDKDIATHLLRTHMLRSGSRLTEVVQHLATVMGIKPTILPMTDDELATRLDTEEHGELEFQEYFVRHRWQPQVKALHYVGQATMTTEVRHAIEKSDIIVIGPSNPWLSIAPILSLPEMRDLIERQLVPRIAVTPIVQGAAIKGPAAKLMAELGYDVSARSVAEYYGAVINAFVFDERDASVKLNYLNSISLDTIMITREHKIALAENVLHWISEMEEI